MGSTSLRVTLICSLFSLGAVSFGKEAIRHESKMVPVEWKSAVESEEESIVQKSDSNLYKVAKPTVSGSDEQPLVHRVFQAPSVYNQPNPPSSSSKFIEGFEKAGQDIGQATSQSVHDLGHGVQNAAQGALDGTRKFLSATGETLGDVADNTINIGNDEYWQQKQREEAATAAAAQNRGVVPPASYTTPINANNSQIPTNNGYNNSGYNNSGYNTPPNNYAAQSQTIPSVPRADTGIATNFGNSNNNNRFMHESQMQTIQGQNNGQTPPLQPANNSFQGNNGNGPYARQGNNQGGFTNPNAPLLTPPNNNQFNNNTNWPNQPVTTISNRQPAQDNSQQFNNRNQAATSTTTVAATNSNTPGGTDGWGDGTVTRPITQANVVTPNNKNPLADATLLVVLVVSLAGNMYGWTTCLELRNKYRASLRRQPGS